MYKSFYKLRKSPFSLSPDPDFLYLSANHKNALAVLERSLVNWIGLSVITGEKGTGKSTLIQYLLKQSWPDVTFGLISEFDTHPIALLKQTLAAFGLNSFGKTTSESYDLLNNFMVIDCFWKKRQPVLIIDEALGIESKALEELYMLSTMEPEENRTLRIILAMPTSLWETLNRPTWTHLSQRVGNSYHLKALDRQETVAYVQNRLRVAGAQNENLFADPAYRAIFRYSGGNPRLINVLCNAALVEGAIQEKPQIGATLIKDLIRQKLWLRAAVAAPQGEAQECSESEGKKVDQAAGVKLDTDDLRPARRDKTGQTVSEFIIADIDHAFHKYTRLDAEVSKASDQHESKGEAPQGTSKRYLRMAAVAAILLVIAVVALLVVRDRSSLGPQLAQSDQDTQGKGMITAVRPLEEARQKLDLPDPIQAVNESDSGAPKFLAQQNSRDVPELQTGDEGVSEDATVDTAPSIPDEPASKPNEIDRGSDKSSAPQESNKDNTTGLIAKEEIRAIVTEPKEVTVPINPDPEQTLPGGTESIEQQVTGLLARAEQQIAAQHLTTPVGDAALETYQSILELVPGHSGALHGITRIKELYLAWTDTARQRGELEKAQSYAERAATVDPQDSDVVQLLDQIKAGKKLKAEMAALQRLEAKNANAVVEPAEEVKPLQKAATEALQKTEPQPVLPAKEPDTGPSDLQAQVVSEVDNLLTKAQQELDAQQLAQPAGDNAWETYQKVLQLDPGNSRAGEGLQRIVRRIESTARDKQQRGDLPSSLAIIEDGLRVFPNHWGLLALKEEINRQLEAQRALKQVEEPSAPTDDEEATPKPKTKKRRRVETF